MTLRDQKQTDFLKHHEAPTHGAPQAQINREVWYKKTDGPRLQPETAWKQSTKTVLQSTAVQAKVGLVPSSDQERLTCHQHWTQFASVLHAALQPCPSFPQGFHSSTSSCDIVYHITGCTTWIEACEEEEDLNSRGTPCDLINLHFDQWESHNAWPGSQHFHFSETIRIKLLELDLQHHLHFLKEHFFEFMLLHRWFETDW